MNAKLIYHITTKEAWAAAQKKGFYHVESLDTEGFIHCSLKEQVEATIKRHYPERTDLILLEIDTEKVKSILKYDPAHGEMFPHLYGELPVGAVVRKYSI